jgi:hypothetical protein
MDAVICVAGILLTAYTLLEVAGLLERASRSRRRAPTAFRVYTRKAADGVPLTIDLEPIPGARANYYG